MFCDPTKDLSCFKVCVSCFKCADYGTKSMCYSCPAKPDPQRKAYPDPDSFCVLSSTHILTKVYDKYKMKQMSEVVIGDLVYTDQGRWNEVIATSTHAPYGKRVTINIFNSPSIVATANHPILTTDEFIEAGGLNKGDRVIYPINQYQHTNTVIDLYSYFNSGTNTILKEGYVCYKNPRAKWHKRFITIDDKLMELLGLYAAEGSCTKSAVQFTYGSHEIELIEKTHKLIWDIFEIEPGKDSVNVDNNTTSVILNSMAIRQFISNIIPGIAPTKSLNDLILTAPINIQRAFLRGFWSGDGGYSPNSYRGSWCADTTSYTLALQIRDLLLRQNIICSWQIQSRAGKITGVINGRNIISSSDLHILKISRHKDFNTFSKIMNSNHHKEQTLWDRNDFSYISNDKLVSYIRSVTIEDWKENEKVSNFTVALDHTYCLPGAATHNCDCRNGILRHRTQEGKLIIAKIPGDPYEGRIIQERKTADENDYESYVQMMRERTGNEHWSPVRFEGGRSTDEWYDAYKRGRPLD